MKLVVLRIGAVALSLLPILACTQSGDTDTTGPIAGGVNVGLVENVADLVGSWRLTTATTTDTCGTFSALLAQVAVVEITQFGTDIGIRLLSPCGTLVAEGTGTVDPSGAVRTSIDGSVAVDADCTLELDRTLIGSLNVDQNLISGADTLTVSAAGVCPAGLPCMVSGTFLALRCPPGDCSFTACGP